ncbi:hypothetical protein AVEN_235560-1 [Araneus ventricosus]|uniref:Uncharacterized protein n=1 Tax=Araneus ventricosus TaxID=182803 RepID=A0A4Y2IW44_ARAVE|nr:hypothetical protein AVEN_235560-1 [Araneus ventricosus]
MMIGSSVDYVRSGVMRNVPATKAVEHLDATTSKFSGCALLASCPAYSYLPLRPFMGPLWLSYKSSASGWKVPGSKPSSTEYPSCLLYPLLWRRILEREEQVQASSLSDQRPK